MIYRDISDKWINHDKCQKTYKSSVGLWKHKKTCCNKINLDENEKDEANMSDKDLIMLLLKENSEFKNMIIKLDYIKFTNYY